MDNKIVSQFAGKLGLLGETNIVEKAKELLRLLELKGTSLTQIGDYARCVICLDLATSLYGHEFDSQTALKLSGFKKPSYMNSRRIIEKLLDLSKPMGVSEICIQLGLTEIQTASKSLLDQFVTSSELRNIDTTHPQYAAMAVYQMCKLKKIKIQKNKLITFGHLKTSQWTLLEKSWETWAKKNPDKLKEFQAVAGTKRGHQQTSPTESAARAKGKDSSAGAQQPTDTPVVIEDYVEWRERVLKRAFRELEQQKAQ